MLKLGPGVTESHHMRLCTKIFYCRWGYYVCGVRASLTMADQSEFMKNIHIIHV